MIIVPDTRRTWRVVGGFIFIVTAWWVQSWAWYTITGVLLADAVLHMDLKGKTRAGFPIGEWSGLKYQWARDLILPSWVVYASLCIASWLMQHSLDGLAAGSAEFGG